MALNSLWNILGQAAPILVALVALPFIVRNIGIERYGLLTLIWVLIGYAGVFDMGIGRALTRLVAQRVAQGKAKDAQQLASAGLALLLMCGLVVAAVCAVAAPLLATKVLKVSNALAFEAELSLLLVSLSLPSVMLTSGYTGVMAAHQQFRPLNLIKVCMGLLTYGGPALLSFITPSLPAAVALLLAMRLVSTLVHAMACRHFCALPLGFAWPRRPVTQELLALGGWITVSNVVSPLLTYMDRFVVAALVPVGFVAYYATSFDLLARSMVLPYSLMAAVFPVASAVVPKSPGAAKILQESSTALLGLMFPVTFVFFTLAEPGLALWLGADFAEHGGPVLKILAVGVLINTLAQAPATLIQAAGQPRWMAIAHLCELPVFVAALWLLTAKYGIVGTALAAALRNGIDALIVALLAMRGLTEVGFSGMFFVHAVVVAALFTGSLFVKSPVGALGYACFGVLAFAAYFWRLLLKPEDRRRLLAWRHRQMPSPEPISR